MRSHQLSRGLPQRRTWRRFEPVSPRRRQNWSDSATEMTNDSNSAHQVVLVTRAGTLRSWLLAFAHEPPFSDNVLQSRAGQTGFDVSWTAL